MNHEHYLRIARACSKNASYCGGNKVKLGCVIVYKGTILAKGWNTNRTHTKQMRYNHFRYISDKYCPPTIHAEIMALAKIRYLDIDFSKVIVYVWREYKDGKPAMARPCSACFAAIRDQKINTIVYSTDDGYAVEKIIKN